jgi:hypothetical protein
LKKTCPPFLEGTAAFSDNDPDSGTVAESDGMVKERRAFLTADDVPYAEAQLSEVHQCPRYPRAFDNCRYRGGF